MQPMAKAPKRITVAALSPSNRHRTIGCRLRRLPHIQQVAGGEQLAEEELRLRLESGDVEAQERRVTPGEGIDTHTAVAGGL